ncbi:MAG TPA: flavin reductase family protein [Actinophytocola sp.]|uniref:flavin reductase family protein n=1 Tax=Actinophytocola sp. TaxID=1872138 RepID=UPI002DB79A46|nr:flavin reductase family protein [Actinophytocola sp.]HEU5470568.1 flavin reductase family protein [Actinophytocola sp.]
MAVDARQLRNCLGHFATGVTVVSCEHEGRPHGATVNAFAAVSLDPPLVMVSLDRRSRAGGYLGQRPFTVNVLRERQTRLARHFAGQARASAVEWAISTADRPPRLVGSLAVFECEPWRTYDGGDHQLFLGEVVDFEYHGGDPLVFYRGQFRHLLAPLDETLWLGSLDCPDLSWILN